MSTTHLTPDFVDPERRLAVFTPEQTSGMHDLPNDWRQRVIAVVDEYAEENIWVFDGSEPMHPSSREDGTTPRVKELTVSGDVLFNDPRLADWMNRLYTETMLGAVRRALDPSAVPNTDPTDMGHIIGIMPGERGEAHEDVSPIGANLYIQAPTEGGRLLFALDRMARSYDEIAQSSVAAGVEDGGSSILMGRGRPHVVELVGGDVMRIAVNLDYQNDEYPVREASIKAYNGQQSN